MSNREEWRDIKGFPGYQISSEGRVRSHNKTTCTQKHGLRTWRNRIIKQKVSKCDGRARIILWKDGEPKTLLVHRLQAMAFLGDPPQEGLTVNHKDGNPLNNVVENLEWMTIKENIVYGFQNGQYSSAHPVVIKNRDGEVLSFRSKTDCSKYLGRSVGYFSAIKGHTLRDKDGNTYEVVQR